MSLFCHSVLLYLCTCRFSAQRLVRMNCSSGEHVFALLCMFATSVGFGCRPSGSHRLGRRHSRGICQFWPPLRQRKRRLRSAAWLDAGRRLICFFLVSLKTQRFRCVCLHQETSGFDICSIHYILPIAAFWQTVLGAALSLCLGLVLAV